MSSSMHEVFHWGPNTSGPKKLSLSVAGSQIDFEGPPSPRRSEASRYSARNRHSMVMVESNKNHGEMQNVALSLKYFCWQCFWCGFVLFCPLYIIYFFNLSSLLSFLSPLFILSMVSGLFLCSHSTRGNYIHFACWQLGDLNFSLSFTFGELIS